MGYGQRRPGLQEGDHMQCRALECDRVLSWQPLAWKGRQAACTAHSFQTGNPTWYAWSYIFEIYIRIECE